MNSQKKYKKSNQNKKSSLVSKIDKFTVKEGAFEDIESRLNSFEDSGLLVKTAFGSYTFDGLTEMDIGNHVAIFVDYENINKFFHDKKFDKGNDQHSINNFNEAFQQSSKAYGHLIPKGSFITGELMNQNREYTKRPEQMSVVLHGSIVASIPQEMIDFINLEALCESYKMEGFVVVCTETSSRFKLKRCYFPQENGYGKNLHASAPTKDEFSKQGLILCHNGNYGYHVASLANVLEKQTIAEKQINGFDTSLVVRTNEDTIAFQLKNTFDGDKMINFFETIGEGKTYRYIDKCNFTGSKQNLEFQKKFDGESILLHVDIDGKFHMMIRFNLDIFKVLCNDGNTKIRIGCVKK